jgi:2,4-dienoyl-CoA reductase-like NADH-dependent reductase (Old Yellow Enzyme family)
MSSPLLFSPISLGPMSLPNRIMISPMCQYSAHDGNANAWHMAHLGSLALSGAGLLSVEATAVSPEGRITPGCLGLYSDENEHSLRQVVDMLRGASHTKLMLQLAHAGRKASSARPWEGGALLSKAEGGWDTIAPSALPHKPEESAPSAMSRADIERVTADFAHAARRARRLGFDAIELHAAHGYLLHEFLSPIANQRDDEYGGSLDNRMRLLLQVFEVMRSELEAGIALGIRVTGSDWVDGGWTIEDCVTLCQRLETAGADFVDVSSGGVSPLQKISIGPGYQVHFAAQVKQAVKMPVITVGMITEPQQAEDILKAGQADMVALARAFISDPRWPWHAAAALGGKIKGPPQYYRCLPSKMPKIFGDITTNQR